MSASNRTERKKQTKFPLEQKVVTENIDYMHPHGKPKTLVEDEQSFEAALREKQASKRQLDEADGHHMCHNACQKHHRVSSRKHTTS
jgi:hypothetical protein